MKCWRILLVLAQMSSSVLSFYHEQSALTFQANVSIPEDSAFGYSVTYMRKTKRLLISAPNADEIGRIFVCHINTVQCDELSNQLKGNIEKNQEYGAKLNHGLWFGAKVKYWNDRAVVCAPRYLEHRLVFYFLKFGIFSHCYYYEDTIKTKQSTPLQQKPWVASNSIEKLMETYGWSIDTFKNEMLVGGPGMFTGRVQLFDGPSSVPININFSKKKLINGDVRFNFGYSIAFGRFIQNDDDFAISSPYGTIGYGKILLYVNRTLVDVVMDDTVGSLFGAVLCSARLLGEHSSMLVGAPATSLENGIDVGAVYIYNLHKGSVHNRIPIFGSQSSGYFGSAIENIGDIDYDGVEDIAIAAPYEDNGIGAVYIYSGKELSSGKLFLNHAQRITPAGSSITGFGVSLAALDDYDDNGCNELAVGTPYSNRVVLYKCFASVELIVETPKFPNMQVQSTDRNETFFRMYTCITVKYPEKPHHIIGDVLVKVTIQHVDAKLTSDDPYMYNVSLESKPQETCNSVDVITPLDGNYNEPIETTVTASLINNPKLLPYFKSSSIILGENSVLITRKSVWATNCKASICVPNLEVTMETDLQNGYIIGSTSNNSLIVKVLNFGEIAYSACVVISGVRASVTPPRCDKENMTLVCPLTIKTNGSQTINITIDTSLLTSVDKTYEIQVDTYNFCKSGNVTKTQIQNISLNASIEGITVETKPSLIIHNAKNRQENHPQTDIVNFIISQEGPTIWENVLCVITLSKTPNVNVSIPMVILHSNSVPCTLDNSSDSKDWKAFCHIGIIAKYHDVTIVIPVTMKATATDVIKDLSLKINMELHLGDNIVNKRLETKIHLEELLTVPLWIYIVSAVFGLFVILIIGFLMNECNCFRRKKHEELEKMKRASIRYSSTRSQKLENDDSLEVITESSEETDKVISD